MAAGGAVAYAEVAACGAGVGHRPPAAGPGVGCGTFRDGRVSAGVVGEGVAHAVHPWQQSLSASCILGWLVVPARPVAS